MTCRKPFLLTFVLSAAFVCALTSCAREGKESMTAPPNVGAGALALEDGVYAVDFESDGAMFHGPSHLRVNLALPTSRVEEALDRLATIF